MAGSTNIEQFNPPISNIETDAQYIADSLRSAGITTDAILSSKLLNKIFYNNSTLAAALGLMLANKGYVVSDGSTPYVAASSPSAAVTALAAVLANMITTADLTQFRYYLISTNHGQAVNVPASSIAVGASIDVFVGAGAQPFQLELDSAFTYNPSSVDGVYTARLTLIFDTSTSFIGFDWINAVSFYGACPNISGGFAVAVTNLSSGAFIGNVATNVIVNK